MSRTHGGPDGLHWNDPSLAFVEELENGSPKASSRTKAMPTLADFMREQVQQGVEMAARAIAGEYAKGPGKHPHVQTEDVRPLSDWVWHPGAV